MNQESQKCLIRIEDSLNKNIKVSIHYNGLPRRRWYEVFDLYNMAHQYTEEQEDKEIRKMVDKYNSYMQ